MTEEIRVHVVNYGSHRNLVMRYRDPLTNKFKAKTTGTKNRTKAERAAAKWEDELRTGRYRPPVRTLWDTFKDKYTSEVLSGLSNGTDENRNTVFNHIDRVMKPYLITELTTQQLSAFVAKLREDGIKETTVDGYLGHLQPVLSWAVEQGYLATMPKLPKTKLAGGVNRSMRGRPITGEELDRMIAKVPEKRKREPEKWQRLLRGLDISGLRLGEALALSWDASTPISVSMSGKYPALVIWAEAHKRRKDQRLPIAPEFADFLRDVPEPERHGLVFGIYGLRNQPLTTKRASRYISDFGEAAGIIVNHVERKYASAQDLRRTFGTRWAKKVMPAVLKELMRHVSITTTMKYYVEQNADDIGDLLRVASGNTLGNTRQSAPTKTKVAQRRKPSTIET